MNFYRFLNKRVAKLADFKARLSLDRSVKIKITKKKINMLISILKDLFNNILPIFGFHYTINIPNECCTYVCLEENEDTELQTLKLIGISELVNGFVRFVSNLTEKGC